MDSPVGADLQSVPLPQGKPILSQKHPIIRFPLRNLQHYCKHSLRGERPILLQLDLPCEIMLCIKIFDFISQGKCTMQIVQAPYVPGSILSFQMGLPVEKLSGQTTRLLCSNRRSTILDPIKPAPPVIRILVFLIVFIV